MSKVLNYAIPTMLIGLVAAIAYALFSASGGGSKQDPVSKFATGTLSDLDTNAQGELAPVASFLNAAENTVTLQDFEGELVLVNFWATWCGPCEREMPSLAALQSARGGQGLRVVAISVDSPEDTDYAKKRLSELSGNVLDFYRIAPGPEGWNVVYDSGASGGFPTSILFGPDGTKIAKLEGEADWASYEAIGLVDALLSR